MGKKADKIQAELDELRAQLSETESLALSHRRENDELREQIAEIAMPKPIRLVTDGSAGSPPPARAQIAKALGVVLEPGEQLTDERILEAINVLKGEDAALQSDPDYHPAMSKNDSLAEAVAHNHRERYELHDALSRARGIIQRIGAALQVSQWNSDGDEIIEKAQRFDGFAFWVRDRIKQVNEQIIANVGPQQSVVAPVLEARGAELRTVLARLLAPKDLAGWIAKLAPKAPTSQPVLELAAAAPASYAANTGDPALDIPFDAGDFLVLKNALTNGDPERVGGKVAKLMDTLDRNRTARTEFTGFMNAVILPLLRKHHVPS